MITKLALASDAIPNFSLRDGVLRFKNRIWIGQDSALQQQLIHAVHASPVGGHSGIPVTYRRAKQIFAWSGMKQSITQFVQACSVCHQAKADRTKLPGLLQPLPVPERAWQVISMDFIEGLPTSQGFNCILVVVDLFSKYAHFLRLKHPFTASSVAPVFLQQVYRLHGLPTAIVSDWDKIFTSHFWQELFRLAQVELRLSSAYHPQLDGQSECVNQCLETFLRCFVHACPSQWSKWIDLAEYWYNTSWHSAHGHSPFEVLYGYAPTHFGISAADATPVSDLSSWLTERNRMVDLIRQHLVRAKERMKKYADTNRSERVYQVNDWVFLKIQPYVQSSLTSRANPKLSFKFFGPFRILARVGNVAYKLELPQSSSIHPVVHVSQLKRALGPPSSVTPLPSDQALQLSIPEKIIQQRTVLRGTSSFVQGLVKWSLLPAALATWEDLEALRQQFPRAAV